MSYNEIKFVKLKDISVGKGSYGIAAPAVDYSIELPTYLRITDIDDFGKLDFENLKSIDDEKSHKYVLQENDIVFARTGASTGRAYFYEKKHGEFVYAGFLIKFSLDPKLVNPKYMKYFTLSDQYQDWVKAYTGGSTRGNINAKTYGNMDIILPSREQQDYLVSVLSSLDDKIEINNKINKNLEELAQTLYKQWFVDFEFPNEDGEPYKSSGGEMVESELGLIPKGWKITDLGKLLENSRERIGFNSENVLSAVKEGKLVLSSEYFNKKVASKDTSKYLKVSKYDFAYNPSRINIGSIGMNEFNFIGCVSPVYVVLKSQSNYKWFFTMFFRTDKFNQEVRLRAFGSVRQSLKYEDLARIKIATPMDNTLADFNKIYYSCYQLIKHIEDENQVISKIRDTLLPKLMNGEIEVPIEK